MKRTLALLAAAAFLSGCAAQPTTAPAPASPAAETPAAAAGIVPGADPEVDAVVTAWTTVFDSAVPVADKLAHLADPALAEPVLSAYAAAGQQVGGIALAPTEVTVDGDTATVVYDVLFGGTAAYSGQDGTIGRVDGEWVVGTEQFCAFMAAARTPCPA